MKTLTRQGTIAVLIVAAAIFISIPTQAQDSKAPDSTGAARKVIVETPAVYPTLARSMNIHGVVKLEALVEANGTVKKIDVKGGHPLLTRSAVTAVGHWRFAPAPHETKEQIEIKFEE
jgi:TonB family protein